MPAGAPVLVPVHLWRKFNGRFDFEIKVKKTAP
jgi:hypothetical protein